MNAIKIPKILLPAEENDYNKWAVIACDQYTSDRQYWERVENFTRGAPSAYNIIFPEVYLKEAHAESRIEKINADMRSYLSSGVFKELEEGFVLVERTTSSGTRNGIILAIDLEDYSFVHGDGTLIRSTEATILERIPPRVKIRENAPLELPHVMLLYNDKRNIVLNGVERGEVLYDFELMFGGGKVKGTFIKNSEEVKNLLYSLADNYGTANKLLFAVGDGNHSFATAKTYWDNLKKTLSDEEQKNHPARYALCEAVNIYDSALAFEPIHRFIKTDKAQIFAEGLKTSGGQTAYIVIDGEKRKIPFDSNVPQGIRLCDNYISEFLSKFGGEVDYVHDETALIEHTKSHNAGLLLPSINKEDFFRLIVTGGELPRKTFSMGEEDEKRFYLEAKLIK